MLSAENRTIHVRALPLPRASPFDLCRVGVWCLLTVIITMTFADPDLWGHLRFGLDMLESGAFPAADPYSFTSDRPWINHEWLAELLSAVAYTWLGSAGLVLLKLAAVLTAGTVLWRVATREGARPIFRDLFVAVGIVAMYSRLVTVRPQIFSVAIFCVLLFLFREWDRGRRRALWLAPILFALWANLHGGWLVGLAVLGVWAAGDLWQSPDRRRAATLGAVVALSAAASLLNPYGIGLWQFLAETVRPTRPNIGDWQPLLELPPIVLALGVPLPLAAAVGLWKARGRMAFPIRDLAVVGLLAAAALRVGRIDAFLQAAIAVLLAPHIVALLNGIRLPRRITFHHRTAPVGVACLALAFYTAANALQNVRTVLVTGEDIPDRTAAMFLRDARPGARVLTWFDWGQYAIWHLAPAGIKVSMDGRRETVYTEQFLDNHFRFYAGEPDMLDFPDRIGADHIWLPSSFAVTDRLEAAGWTRILDTGQSVVLARRGPPAVFDGDHASEPRVFPWP